MFPDDLTALAERVRDAFVARGLWLATAESCTGGLIAGCLTSVSGSSALVDRGFVTYTNAAKTEMLGVPAALIAAHGAVSEPVATAMACGVLAHSRADVALSVTGIAGPTGGTASKPVGLVWLGAARRDGPVRVERHVFPGDRTAVRLASVRRSLELALDLL
ncbi:CinA family protein [Rhodospirillum centenum]|uniref:Competence/damage-inducible protein CinA, putative n=1 Tax=Rhodospirillum centenum (strain ATCC 51521 / SW) TaxID=414684 RepID=B6IQ38_RHOCS|nr:CinA family protein [Rhodospirillum centenum]ACI97574.1 competence/damage-inducible protein CinA, putative [Rhodospirillum centenum SW]